MRSGRRRCRHPCPRQRRSPRSRRGWRGAGARRRRRAGGLLGGVPRGHRGAARCRPRAGRAVRARDAQPSRRRSRARTSAVSAPFRRSCRPSASRPAGPRRPRRPRPQTQRWVNVELEDQPRDPVLAAHEWYTLAFDVDVAQHAAALTTAPFADESLFPHGVDEIVVTVQLDSADFDIADADAAAARAARRRVAQQGALRHLAAPRRRVDADGDAAQGRQLPAEHRDHVRRRRHAPGARSRRRRAAGRRRPRAVLQPRDIGLSLVARRRRLRLRRLGRGRRARAPAAAAGVPRRRDRGAARAS